MERKGIKRLPIVNDEGYLLGIVSVWLGITRILEDSGLIYRIAHLFRPLISRLFNNIPGDHPSITAITLNVLANLFGLGNAATLAQRREDQIRGSLAAQRGQVRNGAGQRRAVRQQAGRYHVPGFRQAEN